MNIIEILNTQKTSQITHEHINNLEQLINNHQRAEAYLYYANLVGEESSAYEQLMMQAQITTYSGVIGGAALIGNYNAKINNVDKYNITLDEFSKNILEGLLDTIKQQVQDHKSGILTADEIQLADQNVWNDKKMVDYFPGNYQLSLDLFDGNEESSTNIFTDLQNLTNAAIFGAPFGQRIAEFSGENYIEYHNGHYMFEYNPITDKIEAVFSELDWDLASILNNSVYGSYPSIQNGLWREQLHRYLGANEKYGASIYDGFNEYFYHKISLEDLMSQFTNDFASLVNYEKMFEEWVKNDVHYTLEYGENIYQAVRDNKFCLTGPFKYIYQSTALKMKGQYLSFVSYDKYNNQGSEKYSMTSDFYSQYDNDYSRNLGFHNLQDDLNLISIQLHDLDEAMHEHASCNKKLDLYPQAMLAINEIYESIIIDEPMIIEEHIDYYEYC